MIGGDPGARPPALSSLQPLTPPALERVIRRCLAKDPDARWQSAADVADELRWLRESGGAGAGAVVTPGRSPARRVALTIGGAVLVAAVGAAVMWLVRPTLPRPSVQHLTLDVGPADELNAGSVAAEAFFTPGGSLTAMSWAPDGQSLVFIGRRGSVQQLYVRRLDAVEARPLPGTEDATAPVVAPDGRWVAYWAGNGATRKCR